MLKKFKILVATIVLTLVGVFVVLAAWVYSGYVNREEILVTDIERSLFNTIQTYYKMHEDSIKNNRNNSWQQMQQNTWKEVKKAYPEADVIRLENIWDSIGKERAKEFDKRRDGRMRRENRDLGAIVPSFMLQSIDFNEHTVDELNAILQSSLKDKKVFSLVELELKTEEDVPDRKQRKKRYSIEENGDIVTRPILVDPLKDLFITARVNQPKNEILTKIAPQLLLSLILFLFLAGTFYYLVRTIVNQNKMALLRKSFVNNMTHELKTPVATVMAAIEAVQRYGAKNDRQKMEKYLAISHRELEHLSGLIEKVLQLDVDGVNGLVLSRTSFDLVTLVEECAEVARLGTNKNVAIRILSDVRPIDVKWDLAHIKNVFNNLFDNAIKYAEENVEINVNLNIVGSEVIIEVGDNGIGIAANYHQDIFEMFFRVPSRGNLHPVKGFGLGLAYVSQIVKQHQGEIRVESEVGKGTTFKITLPKI